MSRPRDPVLLVEVNALGWFSSEEYRDLLGAALPGAAVRAGSDHYEPGAVLMYACSAPTPGRIGTLPNLRLVQKLGAGVEAILGDPDLARRLDVRVARVRAGSAAQEITAYILAYLLERQRNIRHHRARQAERVWDPVAPLDMAETRVGILGLGHIGGFCARTVAGLGFPVMGWSRGPKSIPGIDCRHGEDGLEALLSACEAVAAILPSTPQTRGLLGAGRLALMRPGALLINCGRGDLIPEAALLAALDAGRPGAAVLDVFAPEPLPPESPLWIHPGVTVTPHVSGWRITGSEAEVAENWRRLLDGRPLLNEVDRAAGY